MPLDTICPRLNPARWPAISHANYRARRERQAMVVYAAPPGNGGLPGSGVFVNHVHNVWFVRPLGEPAPAHSEIVETIQPPAPVPQRESEPAMSERCGDDHHDPAMT